MTPSIPRRTCNRSCFSLPCVLSLTPFGPRHINVKTLFAIRHRLTQGVGMDKALRRMGLELFETHHRGAEDAHNAARILYILI